MVVARNYAASYFDDFQNHDEFPSLPIEEFEILIQKTNLNIKNEEQVYNAVLKWVKGIRLHLSYT